MSSGRSSEIEQFGEVIRQCRRSNYDELADVLEHFSEHDTNQFGPVYHPFDAPHISTEESKRLLWAFKAGRSLQADIEKTEGDDK